MRLSNVPSSTDWELLKVSNKLMSLENKLMQLAFDIKSARSWLIRTYLKAKHKMLTSRVSQLLIFKRELSLTKLNGEKIWH